MIKKRIGLLGAGTVGASFMRLFKENAVRIRKELGIDISLAVVCDKNRQIKKEVEAVGARFTTQAGDVTDDPSIDVVVELIGGVRLAEELVTRALNNGKDVVTANKALLATSGKKIFALAAERGRSIRFEASVAGAIPIIKPLVENLMYGGVREVYGILNGTTNYILYNMSRYNLEFDTVLGIAQEKGYAEKDPTLDVKGLDALHKIAILSFLCFGKLPDIDTTFCEGIETINMEDIQYAQENGLTIKLLAILKKNKNRIDLRVHPTFVPDEHPLAKIDDVLNAVLVHTEKGGPFLFSGLGAGGTPTAISVLSDVVDVCRGGVRQGFVESKARLPFENIDDLKTAYYIRFYAQDRPGVLAGISKILAEHMISIDSVTQKSTQEETKKKHVPIIILTHMAREKDVRAAVARIDALEMIKPPTQIIRWEEL
jgi:homoserine dehydrogenase